MSCDFSWSDFPKCIEDACGLESPSSWEEELDRQFNEALGSARRSALGPMYTKKVLYFVRHAQSKSNLAKKFLFQGDPRVLQPDYLFSGFNSALTSKAEGQLLDVRAACQFLLPEIEAVLFSPLLRTEETARALFECGKDIPWVPLQCLMERTFSETLEDFVSMNGCRGNVATSSASFRARIQGFLKFVWICNWVTFAVVGHSLWFRNFLRFASAQIFEEEPEFSPVNASVWRLELSAPNNSSGLPCISQLQLMAQPNQ